MDNRAFLAAAVLVLSLQIGIAIWWIPQKWHACQRLYSNLPARIVCFSARA